MLEDAVLKTLYEAVTYIPVAFLQSATSPPILTSDLQTSTRTFSCVQLANLPFPLEHSAFKIPTVAIVITVIKKKKKITLACIIESNLV